MDRRIGLVIVLLLLLANLSTIVKVEASTHVATSTSGSKEIIACPDSGSSPQDIKQDAITLSVTLPSPRHYKYRVKIGYELYVEAGGLGSYAKAQVSASVGWSRSIDYLSDGAVGDHKDTGLKTWTSPWYTGYGSSVSVSVQLYAEAKLGTGTGVSSHALAQVIVSSVTLEVEYPDIVTLEVSGEGSTSPSPGVYEVWESSFSASASPASGWVFKYWLLDGVKYSTSSSVTISVSKDSVLTAVFEEQQPQKFRLTISVQGQGSTSPPPGTYSYVEGSEATVSASPAEGWKFSYWLLDGVKKTGNPITVTMNKDHTLVAVFEESGGGSSPPSP
ncbi:MAG: hypothetical protein DRN04_17555, partial [Thermoprotei archaeon]